jgi:ABC-type transport system substrate-binding protein
VADHLPGRSLRLERNPHWAASRAAGLPEAPGTHNVDGFDVAIGLPPEAQVLSIRNGEADFSFDVSCCGGPVAADLAADPALAGRVFAAPGPRILYVTLNARLPPFADARVRRAANLAVDRGAIVRLLGGPAQATPTSGLLPRTLLPPELDAEPYPPAPDLERARALLRQANVLGAVDGGTLHYAQGVPDADVAQALAADLERIGIVVRLRALHPDVYEQYVRNPANADALALATWRADSPDGSAVLDPLLGPGTARGGLNYGDFESARLDDALAAAGREPPGAARRAAYARLSHALAAEEAPWIALATLHDVNLVSERYGGYRGGVLAPIALAAAYVRG